MEPAETLVESPSSIRRLRERVNRLTLRDVVHIAAVATMGIGFALATQNRAGQGGAWVLVGIFSVLPLYVAGRAWRLSPWLHALALALPVSVLVIAMSDEAGWDGAARAARYSWGAALFLAVIAWARTPKRRIALAVVVAGLGLTEYAVAFPDWVGFGDPRRLMWGTFSWENQFGAYMSAIGMVCLSLALFNPRPGIAVIGMFGSVISTCGVIESGSRTCVAALAGAYLLALVAVIRFRDVRAGIRLAVMAVCVFFLSVLATSAVFFPHSAASPVSRVAARLAGTTLQDPSAVTRLRFWEMSIRLGAEHPLTGNGLSTYQLRASCFQPTVLFSTPHSEWALAFEEGGLVALAPIAIVVVASLFFAVWSLRFRGTAAAQRNDSVRWAAVVALVFLILHMCMDFDWSYPSLVALCGLIGGIAFAPLVAVVSQRPKRLRTLISGLAVVGLLVAGVVGWAKDPFPSDPLHLAIGHFPTTAQEEIYCSTHSE